MTEQLFSISYGYNFCSYIYNFPVTVTLSTYIYICIYTFISTFHQLTNSHPVPTSSLIHFLDLYPSSFPITNRFGEDGPHERYNPLTHFLSLRFFLISCQGYEAQVETINFASSQLHHTIQLISFATEEQKKFNEIPYHLILISPCKPTPPCSIILPNYPRSLKYSSSREKLILYHLTPFLLKKWIPHFTLPPANPSTLRYLEIGEELRRSYSQAEER